MSKGAVLHLPGQEMSSAQRNVLIASVVLLGMALIAWGLFLGISGPDRPLGGASALWVLGAILLVAGVPAVICLVRPKPPAHRMRVGQGGAAPQPIPLYESAYLDQRTMASGWVLGQLEREYAAAGLRLSPAGVAPDHAAVELEFMALLCGREAQAWEERRLAQGIEALQRQKAFLDGHLTRWLPRFAGQVAAADGGGFYAAVGELAQAFVSHDSDLLDVLLETFPVAAEAP